VSTRKVDALVQSLGIAEISKSEVGRLCAVLDSRVQALLSRRLDSEHPYLYVDSRYEQVREAVIASYNRVSNTIQDRAVQVAGVRVAC